MIVQYQLHTPLGVVVINNNYGNKQHNVSGLVVNDVGPSATLSLPVILNTRREL